MGGGGDGKMKLLDKFVVVTLLLTAVYPVALGTTVFIGGCHADVDIDKTVWDGSNWVDSINICLDENVEFKIVVTNSGDGSLSNLHITDDLPDFLTYNNDASMVPSSYSDHYIEWHVDELAEGENIVITFSARATSTGEGDNIASVEGSGGGFEGLSPGFWKNHPDDWYGYSPSTTIGEVFDLPDELSELSSKTFMEALNFHGGPDVVDKAKLLLRQAVAALLNAAHPGINYPLSQNEIISQVNDALATLDPDTILDLKDTLEDYNNLGGDFDDDEVSDSDSAHVKVEQCGNPDVEIVKKVWDGSNWVDSVTVNVGEDVKFKITVTNTGDVPLDTYVKVSDDLPDFLTYNNDANPTPTSSSAHHIEWNNLAPLGVGESVTITFSAHADSTGEADNVASVRAKYDCNPEVTDSDTAHVKVRCKDNSPPNKPAKPCGPTCGRVNIEYTYIVVTTDPDGDMVYYFVDWGDGTNSGWIGPYESGKMVKVKHRWTQQGYYQIKVKAKDIYGEESEWSDPLPITMPKSKDDQKDDDQADGKTKRFGIITNILKNIQRFSSNRNAKTFNTVISKLIERFQNMHNVNQEKEFVSPRNSIRKIYSSFIND